MLITKSSKELTILSIIILTAFRHCHCQPEILSEASVSDDVDSCPPWYYHNTSSATCFCRFDKSSHDHEKNIFLKHNVTKCLKPNGSIESVQILLQLSYCMTFDNKSNTTFLVTCPYNTAIGHEVQNLYVILKDTKVSELNNFTCGPLDRGEVEFCKKCRHNFGVSPFTLNLSCFDCCSAYSGWFLYFMFEILPLTVFFAIVAFLRIKPSHGYLNSFILLSQVTVAALSFGLEAPFLNSMGHMSIISTVLVKIIKTLYGFWNLDFFRAIIPGFCVSPALNNLDVVSLQIISVFYPMSLILVAWVIIHLYEKDFRPFVWVWRPFKRCLSHFSVTSNPKKLVVNLFATFLLLSYSKILLVASQLVHTVEMAQLNPIHNQTLIRRHSVLFHEPQISYFSPDHARYVVLSFFLFFALILPPPLILLLYPTSMFQKLLNKCCPKSQTIRMFAHACHGCFKNGLNGTRDCRYFAGAYLLLRIALFLCKHAIDSVVNQWIMVSFSFGVATILIVLYRPYKNPYLNALDFFFMLSFSISTLFAAFVTTNDPSKMQSQRKLVIAVYVFIFLCTLSPLIYMSCLVINYLLKKTKKLKHFLIVRRRDYLDISDFHYDTENSDITDQGQTANILRSRVLNSDSFQSE